jgi:hypothetical protein
LHRISTSPFTIIVQDSKPVGLLVCKWFVDPILCLQVLTLRQGGHMVILVACIWALCAISNINRGDGGYQNMWGTVRIVTRNLDNSETRFFCVVGFGPCDPLSSSVCLRSLTDLSIICYISSNHRSINPSYNLYSRESTTNATNILPVFPSLKGPPRSSLRFLFRTSLLWFLPSTRSSVYHSCCKHKGKSLYAT